LTAQRNRALSLIDGKCDIVIFFDDDFIPSRFWIERVQSLLAAESDIGGVTGRVLKDGVTTGEIEWSEGQSIVDKADSSDELVSLEDYRKHDHKSPYGCNMAFRARTIRDLRFDERLALYGWLEDYDFGSRAAARAKLISTDAVWGVHLGTKRGRTSDLKFGYSQVANPWYLMKKGSINPFEACGNILRGLARNLLGVILRHSTVDRWGRLKGNTIALKDIVLGRGDPENITKL
jgi:glycosyltransferase involved in cell wall biosynthesis